jgi:hypothetical protein
MKIVYCNGTVYAELTVGIERLMYYIMYGIAVTKMPRYTNESRRDLELPVLQVVEYRSNTSCKYSE